MGNLLNRKALLSKDDIKIEKVELPNGDFVFVKEMTGHERDLFEESILIEKRDDKDNIVGYDRSLTDFRAKLAAFSMCDEKGNLLLQPEDVAQFSKSIKASYLRIIVEKSQTLNKVDEESKEEIVKNSEAGQPGASASSSVES